MALTTRVPGLRMTANGVPVVGVVSAEVESVSFCAADRFRATISASDAELAWFSAQAPIEISISVGLDGAWLAIFDGMADCVRIDLAGKLIHLEGRDWTSVFVETQAREAFFNQTSSEIATLLAARHGLAVDASSTNTLAGRYYEADHGRLMLDQYAQATTEWDLLIWLAREEGFDVWVSGKTLYFQPQPAVANPVFSIVPGGCIRLEMERLLGLADGVEVTVKSWSSAQQQALAQSASANGAPLGSRQYVLVRPNLSADQAARLAQSFLLDVAQHERVLDATIPGETMLTTRSIIQLTGTGTAFDQPYRIVRLVRSIGEGGFVEHIQAKAASGGQLLVSMKSGG
jgi:phage protein D